ncbi:MAG: hypothetical protein IPM64_00585 [Phycisphaerales bacterium]|nr:hypothetical protein [Phycisphaerales bacterium]
MTTRNLGLLAVCALALPRAALANAGTPLLWAGFLHLAFGNLLIGLLEGFLLAKLFRLHLGRTIAILVLANYFSAWAGGYFLRPAIVSAFPLDMDNAWDFFWTMVALAYPATLLLELPFVAMALRRGSRSLGRALSGSLAVQTVSYLLLFGWYWMASGTSLFTRMEIVRLSTMTLPEGVLIYFIAADDGHVYRMGSNAMGTRKVFDLASTNADDRLFVRTSLKDGNRWDLAALMAGHRGVPTTVLVAENFAAEAATGWGWLNNGQSEELVTSLNSGPAIILGSAKDSYWQFWAGDGAMGGLRGYHDGTGTQVHFSYETLFGHWPIRNATLLPGDKVLFQLGRDQICMLDPDAKQIALVARGRGPVAVMSEDGAATEPKGTVDKDADPQN